jgi:hypothetical protein
LYLRFTTISQHQSEQEIRDYTYVKGDIYL